MFVVPFFSADALGITIPSIAFTLKWAFPFHVTAAHFAGSFPPSSPKIVKIGTNETIPKYSFDTCLAFLCGGVGTSLVQEQTCIDTSMWAGDICRRDLTMWWKHLNPPPWLAGKLCGLLHERFAQAWV